MGAFPIFSPFTIMDELQMYISPRLIFFEVCYVHSEDTITAFQGLKFVQQVSTEFV